MKKKIWRRGKHWKSFNKPAVNQILAHITNVPSDLIKFCQDNDILVEAYSPIGHGEHSNFPVYQ